MWRLLRRRSPMTPPQMGRHLFGLGWESLLKMSSVWREISLLEQGILQSKRFLLFFFSKIFHIYDLSLEDLGTSHIAFFKCEGEDIVLVVKSSNCVNYQR